MPFATGLGTVLSLELRQRVRGRAWYILLGVFAILVAIVTAALTFALTGLSGDADLDAGSGVLSTIIYFVLLLGTLVTPALSGNAINGDRADGTLATTQVTQITTGQLVLGKFLASWITALAFLAVSVPFLLFSVALGGVRLDTALVSIVVLAFELGVVAAIGVGLSGMLQRSLLSIVVTYLVVAALSVGTLIAFALGGLVIQSTVTSTSRDFAYVEEDGTQVCSEPMVQTYSTPRFDYFWGALVANPYVVLADAVPSSFDRNGYPEDLFGYIKLGARQTQLAPDLSPEFDACSYVPTASPVPREVIDSTVPSWFVGALIQLVLGAAALVGGWAATRTPAGRLAAGSRVA